MSRRTLFVVLALMLALSLIGVAGCAKVAEKAAEKAIEGATGVDVNTDSGQVTIGDNGNSTTVDTENATVPDGWPSDAPVYDGTITASLSNEYEGKTSFQMVIETDDAFGDIHEWFKSELEDNGWTISTNMETDTGSMIIATKDDLQFTMASGDGGDVKANSISEMVAPKQ